MSKRCSMSTRYAAIVLLAAASATPESEIKLQSARVDRRCDGVTFDLHD